MQTMKLTSLGVITILLCSVIVLAGFSVRDVHANITKSTENSSSADYLLKKTFLFGRIQNVTIEDEYSTVEAVNLRIIFFEPFQLFHYTTSQKITFSNHYIGKIIKDSFMVGRFTVVLPINTNSIAVMNTTIGSILIELYEDTMPNTSANFIRLVNDGFYNGLVFHRVIKNFVIQGGGYYPNGTEKESPYGPIDLEINPSVHHLDGTIGMARTSDPNSATNQFFIDDGAQPHLNYNSSNPAPNGYAAFGRVVKGIDVVRTIAQVETMTKYGFMEDWPVDDIIIESVTIVHS
jgi:cyclophilin family peptidyl-prolyl cis-trans isomerase